MEKEVERDKYRMKCWRTRSRRTKELETGMMIFTLISRFYVNWLKKLILIMNFYINKNFKKSLFSLRAFSNFHYAISRCI